MKPRILVVEDDLSLAMAFKMILTQEQMLVTVANDPATALKIYNEDKLGFDIVLTDYRFEGSEITGVDFAIRIKKQNAHQALLYMTGYHQKEIYKAMLETGASKHFIEKGGGPEDVLEPIRRTLAEIGFRAQVGDTLEAENKREHDIRAIGLVGRSKALHALAKQVETYRQFRSRFLILGDTGSGKELIAKAFQIPGKPFYAVDCTRFSEGQEHFLESELFGHKKGAFTGADSDKRGAFDVANGGVVFLDELHCLSLNAQSKLLRTIQEMKFRRLGDTSEVAFDVTIVAAAKPVILEMIRLGTFKEDLYYRLAKATLSIPPLMDRVDDVRPLAKYFAEKYSRKHGCTRELHPQLIRELEAYSWPGNVRELEGVIENMVMTTSVEVVGPESFRGYLEEKLSPLANGNNEPKANLKLVVDSVQSEQIIATLKKVRTVGEAAGKLKTARTTLADRMRRLGIDPRNYLGKRS